jgi:hypothetical protein
VLDFGRVSGDGVHVPYDPPLSALPAARAARARRSRRALGGAVLLLALGGLILARYAQTRSGDEAALSEGAAHLRAAIDGDPTRWAPAEDAFSRAAHGSIFDAYPIFALEMVRRIKSGSWGQIEAALLPSAEALAAGDLTRAREALALAPTALGHDWMARLLDAVQAAAPPR